MNVIGNVPDSSDVLVILTIAELKLFELYFSQQDVVKTAVQIDIPHLPQYGSGADARSNDCGAACAAMIVNGFSGTHLRVDDFAVQFQTRPNQNMTFGDIITAIRAYNVRAEHVRPMMADGIENAIRQGLPGVALVHYPLMPYHARSFDGYHFIVIYGVRDAGDLLYRDPLAPDGKLTVVAQDALNRAMSAYPESDNLHHQAVIAG